MVAQQLGAHAALARDSSSVWLIRMYYMATLPQMSESLISSLLLRTDLSFG